MTVAVCFERAGTVMCFREPAMDMMMVGGKAIGKPKRSGPCQFRGD